MTAVTQCVRSLSPILWHDLNKYSAYHKARNNHPCTTAIFIEPWNAQSTKLDMFSTNSSQLWIISAVVSCLGSHLEIGRSLEEMLERNKPHSEASTWTNRLILAAGGIGIVSFCYQCLELNNSQSNGFSSSPYQCIACSPGSPMWSVIF